MARRGGTTSNKRMREAAKQDKRRRKAERAEERARAPKPVSEHGEDPDIEGIVPGPQPLPEPFNS